ncbi:uncharacterized protein LOC119834051 [Zerene cesonia]|uniref:uncharacterized protein LOC119834051 n=1 Tax=Zerene cesonia TaxID=33412 RepID=UPI0018E4F612|nr:uncharacterized protein LOC119834051 [Zerene cesonia]
MKLLVTERKVLRKILGPIRSDDGSWRIRTNKEVEELFDEPNILGEVKAHRLRWLGHVLRMGDDRAVKRVYLGRPTGRRPVGRPKYRWADQVTNDLVALRRSDWSNIVPCRDKWRLLLLEAKTHFGVTAPDKYLVHCQGSLISKFIVVGAPHPNLYWQHPPAAFCQRSLHFIQWPYFPERWLAEGVQENNKWANSRARDWSGALNYVRGAAWYRIRSDHKVQARCLLIGSKDSSAQLVASVQYCGNAALRLVDRTEPGNAHLQALIHDFIVGKKKPTEEIQRSIMGRVFEAVADKGRVITSRLALPANA